MDTGAKTLAQLSEEGKETKYVTLETGAKISGYTKDYLERLCLLNKVEYRLWSNGNFVIELDSLLRETQAILLSYEGISFVDKNELTDPVPQVVGNILSSALGGASGVSPSAPITSYEDTPAFKSGLAQAVPTFGKSLSEHSAPVSFVGRAVVSDALHPEEKIEAKKEPTKVALQAEVAPPVMQKNIEATKHEEVATHVPVAKFNMSAIHADTPAPQVEKTLGEKVHEHIPVVAVNSKDEWESQLFGSSTDTAQLPPPLVISAAKDGEHHSIDEKQEEAPHPTHLTIEKAPSISADSFVPPSGQKVIVFSGHTKEEKPSVQPEKIEDKNTEIVPSAPIIPAAPTPIVPMTTSPHVPLVTSSVLPILTSTPELNTPKPKTMLPAEGTPVLPMVVEEHHLTPYETHPLMRSTGFNMVFAAMLIASSFVMLGGRVLENIGGKLNTAEYVAGVGASLEGLSSTTEAAVISDNKDALKKGERAMLPFSNDVVATSGEKANTIIVRPVFESGPGKAYEYILVPEGQEPPK